MTADMKKRGDLPDANVVRHIAPSTFPSFLSILNMELFYDKISIMLTYHIIYIL